MPKIKDLGVKVIPETMRPPEMGPGGGGPCFPTNCPTHSICAVPRLCGCTHRQRTNLHTCCLCTFQPTICHLPTICHCSALPTVCAPTYCEIPSVCHAPTVCACSA